MQNTPLEVLLVEDNPADVLLLQESLTVARSVPIQLTPVARLSEALQRLRVKPFDAVLLDLSLPDSWGLETFTTLYMQAPQVPIVVLTAVNDEGLAVKAVQEGAQDYLVKGEVPGSLLVRALRYAMERHQMQQQLRSLALVDSLTGLFNRHGFLTLAAQQVKYAARQQQGFVLFFLDLDGMKSINDTFGHAAGDQALLDAAALLRETFRHADIIARLGGDEFVVLAIDASAASAETLTRRLQRHAQVRNAADEYDSALSFSIGSVYYDPIAPCTLDELLARADAAMYTQKRHKVARRY